ncbi:hypothetical protein GCM10023231_30930 [Olivibacter ginsenosidimutans]|uniref:Thioredoxin domain-containing protein n=1 Tax=Olivibacter ginsenosidimutans TaxID=1176537 RepID=A0ABP9BTN6_9SPHI
MMCNNKDVSKEKAPTRKLWQFIRKNGFSMLVGIAIVILLVNPDAKSWILRQLMVTGIFNANISQKTFDATSTSTVDFDFEDEKGTVQNTSSLGGQVVFINFWASWCPPCRAEFPSIEKLYSKFKNNPDVFFLMINEDNNLAAAKAYLEKEKSSIPLYKVEGNVPDVIYSGTLPTTIVLDKNGKVRFHHEGFANYGAEKFVKQLEELIQE